jgi:hypothetical protein
MLGKRRTSGLLLLNFAGNLFALSFCFEVGIIGGAAELLFYGTFDFMCLALDLCLSCFGSWRCSFAG